MSIEAFDGKRVTLRYIHSRTGEPRRLTLPVHAFLARFLQHVLPYGFPKFCSYGLLSPAATGRGERARELLPSPRPRLVTPGPGSLVRPTLSISGGGPKARRPLQ